MRRIGVGLFALTLGATLAAAQPVDLGGVKASAKLSDTRVPLNRTVTVTVSVEWSGNLDEYHIEDVSPVVSNLELVGTASANRVGEVDGRPYAVRQYEFTYRPQSLGMAYVEAMVVNYQEASSGERRSVVTPRLEVRVVDPVPESGRRRLPVLWVVVGVVLGAVAGLSFWAVKERQAQRHRQEQAQQVVPLEEQYLQELPQAVDLRAPALDAKESSARLSRLLRRYLSEKYSVRALEATTDEVIASLKAAGAEERLVEETSEILRQCDVLKFAGPSAGDPATVQRLYTLVEDILQRNLRAPSPAQGSA
ncbi:MAG: hypothetical protein QHJ34_12780 [bacterium]|jgi:hypothetical protein|nr:hypothetical protein [candidate division KSB1 bacterium]MDH7561087.1 hypothetical protein [bacterium]